MILRSLRAMDCTLFGPDGAVSAVIRGIGPGAPFADVHYDVVDEVDYHGQRLSICQPRFEGVQDLPPAESGVLYLVNPLLAEAVPRRDFLIADGAARPGPTGPRIGNLRLRVPPSVVAARGRR